jgi:hypothetical protein
MSADQQRNADIRTLAEARATEPGAVLLAPAVKADETVYGRVTPERLDEILA